MAFDKNIHADTTDWVTNNEGVGAWIKLNFKQYYEIESLEIRHRSQGTAMRFKEIMIEFSNGESQYYTLNDDPLISNKVVFPKLIVSDFLRITTLSAYGTFDNGYSDIKVFGCLIGNWGVFINISNRELIKLIMLPNHIVLIFVYLSANPNWNWVDMTIRSGTTDDILTSNGEILGSYNNLPFDVMRRFPMYGTTDVNGKEQNDVATLVLSRPMISFMLQSPQQKKTGMEGWEYIKSGKFLGSAFGEIDLYQKLLSGGTHTLETFQALYLFSYDLEGKKLCNI